jgi:hypothetical protein
MGILDEVGILAPAPPEAARAVDDKDLTEGRRTDPAGLAIRVLGRGLCRVEREDADTSLREAEASRRRGDAQDFYATLGFDSMTAEEVLSHRLDDGAQALLERHRERLPAAPSEHEVLLTEMGVGDPPPSTSAEPLATWLRRHRSTAGRIDVLIGRGEAPAKIVRTLREEGYPGPHGEDWTESMIRRLGGWPEPSLRGR